MREAKQNNKNLIFYIDPNNDTPNLNYPLIMQLQNKLTIHFISSYKKEYHDDFQKIFKLDFVHYIFFNFANKIKSSKIRKYVKALEYIFSLGKLLKLIIKHNPIIVHYIWIPIPVIDYYFILFLKKRLNTIVFISSHNFGSHEKEGLDGYRKKVYLLAEKILVHSKYIQNLLISKNIKNTYVIDLGNHYDKLVPYFSLTEKKSEFVSQTPTIKILYTGIIRPYKGVDLLIESFGCLDEQIAKNTELYIVGKCLYSNEREINNLIQDNKYSDKIYFKNTYLQWPSLIALLNSVDICIMPYREASQSGLIYLYYQMGIPVIATNVGGLKEMLNPETSILCFPDSESIGAAITKMASNLHQYNKQEKHTEFLKSRNLYIISNDYMKFYSIN